MARILLFLQNFFFAAAVFAAPLIFFTDLTRNPFTVQPFILTLCCCVLLMLWALKVFITTKACFKFALPDLFFTGFVISALFSVSVNYFLTPFPDALLGEALRRGLVLFTDGVTAYMLARVTVLRDSQNKPLWPVLAWFAMWAFYPTFKMEGLVDIYAILMWGAALVFWAKYLKTSSLRAFLNIFTATAFAASLYGICQYFGFDIFWKSDIQNFGSRVVSTFGNPNFLASYIVMTLPLTFIFYLETKSITNKIYYLLACCSLSGFLALCGARSAWLGIAAAVAVLVLAAPFWRAVMHKKFTAFGAAALILALFFLWPAQDGGKSAVLSRLKESMPIAQAAQNTLKDKTVTQSYHQRMMMRTCGLEMFKESPLIGKGWGSFQLNYAPCQGKLIKENPALLSLMTQANGAHNIFIEILAQSGLVGFLFFLCFIVSIILCALRAIVKAQGKDKLLPLAMLAAFIGMTVDNLLNISLIVNITSFLFFWLASALAVYGREGEEKPVSLPVNLLIFLSITAFCLFIAFVQFRMIKGAVRDHRANKIYAQGDYIRAAREINASLKYYPLNAEGYYLLINSLVKSKNYNDALKASSAAANFYPNYHEFYLRRAILNYNQNKEYAAVPDFKRVLELYPNYGPALAALSDYFTEHPKEAKEEDLNIMLDAGKAMPHKLNFGFVAAKIYISQDNYYKARDFAGALLDTESTNDEYFELLNTINEELGISYDPVIDKYKQLVKARNIMIFTKSANEYQIRAITGQYPGDVSAALTLGEFYFSRNEPLKAIEILQSVYEDNQNNLSLNFALASALQMAGDKEKAAAHLNKILALDSFNVTAMQRLEKLKY